MKLIRELHCLQVLLQEVRHKGRFLNASASTQSSYLGFLDLVLCWIGLRDPRGGVALKELSRFESLCSRELHNKRTLVFLDVSQLQIHSIELLVEVLPQLLDLGVQGLDVGLESSEFLGELCLESRLACGESGELVVNRVHFGTHPPHSTNTRTRMETVTATKVPTCSKESQTCSWLPEKRKKEKDISRG